MASDWRWHGVRGTSADRVWPLVWPGLSKAVLLTAGRYDESSIIDAVRRGDLQLWCAGTQENPYQISICTELVSYPRAKWCRITLCGGSGLPHALGFLGTIEAWARTQGCVGVEASGRPEWVRVLKPLGYRTIAGLCQKVLNV